MQSDKVLWDKLSLHLPTKIYVSSKIYKEDPRTTK
jgi:hypothetical protein